MALIKREDVWALVGDHVMTVRPGSKLEWVIHRYVNAIDGAPEVDAAPVVFCKNCKYAQHDVMYHDIWCNGIIRQPEWYCADGKRRDSE